MKTFCLIVCLGFCLNLKASPRPGLIYKAKFFLKNGERLVGNFETFGDSSEGEYLEKLGNDRGEYEIVKSQVNTEKVDSFTIFKEIHFPKFFKETGDLKQKSAQFGAVAYEDVIKIAFKDINFTVFISVKENKRESNTTGLAITSLEMIDKLNTSKPLSVWETWERNSNSGFLDAGFIFLNYNPKINSAEIERLYDLKKKQLWKEWDFLGKKKKNSTKKWFLEKGIVIVETLQTC